MAAKKTTATTDVALAELTAENLADLQSFDQAVELLQGAGVGLIGTDEVEEFLGDGFAYVHKSALVNIPFVILDLRAGMSPNYNAPYVTVKAMTATNRKVKFVDFGSGFRAELENFERRAGRSAVGMVVKGGLMASTYDTEDSSGNTISATTYRLNLA